LPENYVSKRAKFAELRTEAKASGKELNMSKRYGGTNGYTDELRAFSAYNAKPKTIGRHKKTSAASHQFRSDVLNRVERAVFTPCSLEMHQRCVKVLVQDDDSIPRICSCICHAGRKRRELPTKIVATPVCVPQIYVHENDKAVAQTKLKKIKLHDSLKDLYEAHAEALRAGNNIINSRGTIELAPHYFMLRDRKRHSLRLTVIWPRELVV
jgi:hypothetical protein